MVLVWICFSWRYVNPLTTAEVREPTVLLVLVLLNKRRENKLYVISHNRDYIKFTCEVADHELCIPSDLHFSSASQPWQRFSINNYIKPYIYLNLLRVESSLKLQIEAMA